MEENGKKSPERESTRDKANIFCWCQNVTWNTAFPTADILRGCELDAGRRLGGGGGVPFKCSEKKWENNAYSRPTFSIRGVTAVEACVIITFQGVSISRD